MPIVFNGRSYAKEKEDAVAETMKKLVREGKHLKIKSFTFQEDEGSVLYTRLKKAAAERVGITYEPQELSLLRDINKVISQIEAACKDKGTSGVMVQKPAKSVFRKTYPSLDFQEWWTKLVSAIDPDKDVDCLTPVNLARVKAGDSLVLPATVGAVLSILTESKRQLNIESHRWKQLSAAIVGQSDIVGKPLSWLLEREFESVSLFGKQNLPEDLSGFDIVVSAVGQKGLIQGGRLKEGVIAVDVGAPKGDFNFDSVVLKAAFITPVPGGVGPVTVASLMENAVTLGAKNALVI